MDNGTIEKIEQGRTKTKFNLGTFEIPMYSNGPTKEEPEKTLQDFTDAYDTAIQQGNLQQIPNYNLDLN